MTNKRLSSCTIFLLLCGSVSAQVINKNCSDTMMSRFEKNYDSIDDTFDRKNYQDDRQLDIMKEILKSIENKKAVALLDKKKINIKF